MSTPRSIRLLGTILLVAVALPATAQFSSPTRNVENPDRFPYMVSASGALDPPFVNGFLFFPTPSGARYFIEYVTLSCTTPSASDTLTQALLGTRQNTSPTSSQGFAVPAIALERRGPAPFGGVIWSGAATVKMFSDPDLFSPGGGTSISMNIFHTEASVRATCSGFVYGHTLAQ